MWLVITPLFMFFLTMSPFEKRVSSFCLKLPYSSNHRYVSICSRYRYGHHFQEIMDNRVWLRIQLVVN